MKQRFRTPSKYHSKKVVVDGMTFDSQKELRRWNALRLMEKSGQITDLKRQVKYVLIPAQREPDKIGPRGGVIKGKLLERECAYMADFVYLDKNGNTVVEDTKGVRTTEYVIKRKLMLYVHGIKIVEV